MITSTVTVIVMDPEATATDSRQGLTTDSRQVQIGPDHKNDKESKRKKGIPNSSLGIPFFFVAWRAVGLSWLLVRHTAVARRRCARS